MKSWNARVFACYSLFPLMVASAAPDLVTQSLTLNPTSGNAGSTVNVSFTVKNQGNATAAASTCNIRMATSSSTVTTSDPLLFAVNVPAIAAGGTYVVNQNTTVPAGRAAGQNYVWVIEDVTSSAGQGTANEGNDKSNKSFVITTPPAGAPDLVTQSLLLNPTSGNAGSTVNVSFTVKNQGNATAAASTCNIRMATSSSTVTTSDPLLFAVNVPAIAAGGTYAVNQNTTVPAGRAAGQNYVWVIEDVTSSAGQGTANEANDRNNTGFAINVPTAPDLVTQNLLLNPTSGNAGSTMNVSFTVKNQGNATAAASTCNIRMATSSSTVTTSDPMLFAVNVPAIAAGGTYAVNQNTTVPAGRAAGQNYVWVIEDVTSSAGQGTANEANDRNSTGFTITTPTAPDLVTQNLLLNPTSGNAGSTVNVSFTVKNQGNATAAASTCNIRMATSSSTVTTSDPLLFAVNVPAIGAGGTYAVNQNTTVPAGRVAGQNYVWVIEDVTSSAGQGTANEANDRNSTGYLIMQPPTLSVTPANQSISATADTILFNVSNIGGGTLSYVASITSGGTWLRFYSGQAGGNSGTIVLSCDANSGAQRQGTLQVTASGASGSPFTITITQSAGSGTAGAFLNFPLAGYTPYTAPVASVFDHSGTRYTANYEVIAFTGEKGTVKDDNEPYAGTSSAPLYSYKKIDGKPFICNGKYVGTTSTGSTTLNYDGHPGWDYSVVIGTPVYAAADGQVETVDATGNSGSGKYIRLQHGAEYQSQYLHLSETMVAWNENVTKGQLIGKSGNSGGVAAHLHFEVKKNVSGSWIAVDPYGWTGSGTDPYNAQIGGNNKLLWIAGISPVNHLVTPNSGVNGNISPSTPQTVSTLGGVKFSASPATPSVAPQGMIALAASTGYVVDQWLVNGIPAQSGGTNFTLGNVTADTTVQVTFKVAPSHSFTVTPTADSNGSISPDIPWSVSSGSSMSFTATPLSGYVIDQWYVNSVAAQTGGTAFTLVNVIANTAVQVTFKTAPAGTGTIVASPSPNYGGTASGSGAFAVGSTRTVTAIANPGYSFLNWTENGIQVSSLTSYTFVLAVSRNVVANFTATPFVASDTDAPALQTTQPYSSGRFVTTNGAVTLTGVASDLGHGNNGISIVTVNGVEAFGDTIANGGTANWSLPVILHLGANVFTVVAKDNSPNANSRTTSVTVTYLPFSNVPNDFDGEGRSDFATYWPVGGTWNVAKSSGGSIANRQLGSSNMVPVAADYDGDGICDLAVYHAVAGTWYIQQSTSETTISRNWGYSAAVAVPADYDGDGKTDLATYVPSEGKWYVWQSGLNQGLFFQWGWSQAIPVPGDYDGDGKADLATYVPGEGKWYIWQSGLNQGRIVQWGWSQAMPVPADYDGDGKTDLATYVPAEGKWYIWKSGLNQGLFFQWGWSQAIPVPGDYDGDGKADLATYVPAEGKWYIWQSGLNQARMVQWGWSQAVPVMPQFQINRRYFPTP